LRTSEGEDCKDSELGLRRRLKHGSAEQFLSFSCLFSLHFYAFRLLLIFMLCFGLLIMGLSWIVVIKQFLFSSESPLDLLGYSIES